MQRGQDCCRHLWWSADKFFWWSVDWDKPAVRVIHDPFAEPTWNCVTKPPNFTPFQNAKLEKNLCRAEGGSIWSMWLMCMGQV
jgi:hypothetical protein